MRAHPQKDSLSLKDFALGAGFSSHADMAAVFHRLTGITPANTASHGDINPLIKRQFLERRKTVRGLRSQHSFCRGRIQLPVRSVQFN
jgi:AraC-like DNA-binding protein